MEKGRSKALVASQEQASLADPDDILGKALLGLLSRGAAILTEIHRLAEHIPDKLLDRHSGFLFTFLEYFSDPERNETRLNLSAATVQADEEFQSAHVEYFERFYNVCVGIVRYARDFNRVVKDLKQGYYISHTLEQVLLDLDGKQWLPECLHMLGASILLLNEKFSADVRQRLVIAQYRLRGEAALIDFDEVLALVNDVETKSTTKCSTNEVLLSRLKVDGRLARAVTSRIQADDIYGHSRAWPLSEHRSTALANQSALLIVALLFTETGLKNDRNSELLPLSQGRMEMREIVDKHFSDQWVVVLCTGYVLDLELEWAPYPAAKAAIADVIVRSDQIRSFNLTQVGRVQSRLDEYLTRGVLSERFVTENWNALLQVIREANVALRWRLLHCQSQTYRNLVNASSASKSSKLLDRKSTEQISPTETIKLLLGTSQLEYVLREAIRRVLASKDETWKSSREHVAERMKELSQYFSGNVPLAKIHKDEGLMKWFQSLGEEVLRLEYSKMPTAAGRRVQAVIKALEEVERFDGIDASLQVREFLSDSRVMLDKMVRTVHVREEILAQIDVVSDMTYTWGSILDFYDSIWHDRVRQDPSSVSLFKSVFVKLTSVLDTQITRLAQAGSADMDSVAVYWSNQLVRYVRRILQVVPQSICRMLDVIGELVHDKLPEIPSRQLVSELGHLAAGEARYSLARSTNKIAIFCDGIASMGNFTLGVMEINPKQVLNEGMRKELRSIINSVFELPAKQPSNMDWGKLILERSETMVRLRKSFEYIQDFLGLNAYATWNEVLNSEVMKRQERSLDRFLGDMTTHITKSVDWMNEKQYDQVLDQVYNMFGVFGFVRMEHMITLELENLAEKTLKRNHAEPGIQQLRAKDDAELWGTANWVDCIREARRKFHVSFMEVDFAQLVRIGLLRLILARLQYRVNHTAKVDTELLESAIDNQESHGRDSPLELMKLCVGIRSTSLNMPHQSEAQQKQLAYRVFILMNELAKRIVNERTSVFDNFDYFYTCIGVSVFKASYPAFALELDRCVYFSSTSLSAKSLEERQVAASSLVFTFTARKVAKLALERMLQEQTIHRVIAHFVDSKASSIALSPPLVLRVAEAWLL